MEDDLLINYYLYSAYPYFSSPPLYNGEGIEIDRYRIQKYYFNQSKIDELSKDGMIEYSSVIVDEGSIEESIAPIPLRKLGEDFSGIVDVYGASTKFVKQEYQNVVEEFKLATDEEGTPLLTADGDYIVTGIVWKGEDKGLREIELPLTDEIRFNQNHNLTK